MLASVPVALALLAGCGNHDVSVAPECGEGAATVRSALAKAPGDVRLRDHVRISDCFQQAASAADVQTIGAIFIETADQLAERVRVAPRSHAAVELGYLLGAVRRGAGTESGIHYEAERRFEEALVGLRTDTPEFRRGLAAGHAAG